MQVGGGTPGIQWNGYSGSNGCKRTGLAEMGTTTVNGKDHIRARAAVERMLVLSSDDDKAGNLASGGGCRSELRLVIEA